MSARSYTRRQLMLEMRKPYDAEIEYLESTSGQYIDTLLFYFADFEVGVKLRRNANNYLLGMDINNYVARISSSRPYWQFASGRTYSTNISILQYHVLKWVDDKIFCDGAYLSDLTKTRANFRHSMMLFGVYDSGGGRPNIIYYCKLYSPTTHTIVRDYIPVRVGTTGYMYDKVSGELFGNAGTGSFILGPDK